MSVETRVIHKIKDSKGHTIGWIEIIKGTVFVYKKHAKKPSKKIRLKTLLEMVLYE